MWLIHQFMQSGISGNNILHFDYCFKVVNTFIVSHCKEFNRQITEITESQDMVLLNLFC